MPAMAPPLLPPRPQATPFSKHFPPATPRHHHGPATPQGETASKPRRPATPQGERNLTAGARPATPQGPRRPGPATPQGEHPVEVVCRVRDLTAGPSSSALEVPNGGTVRVRQAGGCRDFSLDGVSLSEEEDLDGFYRRFVRSRVDGVRVGANCTIMVYGPTGSGKTHTMFGKQQQQQQQHGIIYRAIRDLLDDGGGGEGEELGGVGLSVKVTMLEIYNDDIYDLLATPKVRLEVMGKKAKNTTHISGNEAGKISREVAEVEKRRTVKSTLCNERSSRSHFMIILDVPSVGGRLMLVDMAGSENIEAAGQTGFEAKMQTANINRANTALKRVVESIANGDSHVPFRDSKLTMLLEDSFENDRSKILMILCASPDPKELHKTVSTLEYGAKAKCIIRAAHASTPRDKMNSEESYSMLNSRIEAMNKLICKLQKENEQREKEHYEVLRHKEEELAQVRARLWLVEGQDAAAKEEARILKSQLQMMEEKMLQQELLADEAQKENKLREKERIEAQTVLRHKEEELAQVRAKLRLMEGQGAAAKEEAKVRKREELQMMEEKMVRQQQELLAPQRTLQEVEPEKLEAHNYFLPQGVNLTIQVREKINEKVETIKSDFPIFVKVMSLKNLGRMEFARSYASACLPEDNNHTMIFRVEGKRKSWRTMLKVNQKQVVREIRDRGWKDFVTDNGVEAGDICIFELVKRCTKSLTMKVHLIHRLEIDTQTQTKARSA